MTARGDGERPPVPTGTDPSAPITARVSGGGSPRLVATALSLLLAGLVGIGAADRLLMPAPVLPASPALTPAAPSPAVPTPPTDPVLEVRIVRDGEQLSSFELGSDSGGFSGFLSLSSHWYARPPQIRVVRPAGPANEREQVLFQEPLSLGDPNRPGLPQDLAAGRLWLVQPMRGLRRWEYRVLLEARQPSGLNVAIEVVPSFP